MNVRIFWVRAMKCMYAQTRPRFILSSERVFGGMEFEPMLTPREKSPLPENVPRGGSNPWRCGQRAQTLACMQTFSDWFFFQIWALHFDISLDDLDLHSRSQLYSKSKTLVSIFSDILLSIWMKCGMWPQPVGLLKLMLNLFCTSYIQGRELCWHNFIKYTINIVTNILLMLWLVTVMNEAHASCVSWLTFKRDSLTLSNIVAILSHWIVLGCLSTNSFQIWCYDRHLCTVQFDTWFSQLDLHSVILMS